MSAYNVCIILLNISVICVCICVLVVSVFAIMLGMLDMMMRAIMIEAGVLTIVVITCIMMTGMYDCGEHWCHHGERAHNSDVVCLSLRCAWYLFGEHAHHYDVRSQGTVVITVSAIIIQTARS